VSDVLVIGAGLAGLAAAWQSAAGNKKVRLIAKGWGATHWHAGCIDALGYFPLNSQEPLASPTEGIEALLASQPEHPYALVGLERLAEALAALQELCGAAGYPLHGSLEHNWLLPSAVGTFRPTCLAPETMIAGDLNQKTPMLIVGFKQLVDFYPNVAADNLTAQGIPAAFVMLDLPTLQQRNFTNPVVLARLFEKADFRAQVGAAVKPQLGQAERVGFPAVLGLNEPLAVKQDLERQLGRPVFEIPSLPPSIAGMRLHQVLVAAIERLGGRVFDGMEALAADSENGLVTAVHTEAAARPQRHRAGRFILASGGILGGGIQADHQGRVREVIFDLPVQAPDGRLGWFKQDFLDRDGHPIYRAGLKVDERFRPVNGSGPIYENLLVAGTTLAGCEVIRERSFDGVALATGYAAGRLAAEEG
jgi:glycerol-3-phosphate dehydrogenase subunit B